MTRTFSFIALFGGVVCSAAIALGQAGAPTQRAHIPGIPDGSSIYPKSVDPYSYVSIGCISKTTDGEFRITDWRGGEQPSVAGAPPIAASAPLILRLEGDKDMFNFQTGHEVEIRGPILEDPTETHPAKIKVESLLYLSRTCWKRGYNTTETAKPKP